MVAVRVTHRQTNKASVRQDAHRVHASTQGTLMEVRQRATVTTKWTTTKAASDPKVSVRACKVQANREHPIARVTTITSKAATSSAAVTTRTASKEAIGHVTTMATENRVATSLASRRVAIVLATTMEDKAAISLVNSRAATVLAITTMAMANKVATSSAAATTTVADMAKPINGAITTTVVAATSNAEATIAAEAIASTRQTTTPTLSIVRRNALSIRRKITTRTNQSA